jgi:hypothetical protein
LLATAFDTPSTPSGDFPIGEFFSAPIIGDRPALRLVVDNDRSKTAP